MISVGQACGEWAALEAVTVGRRNHPRPPTRPGWTAQLRRGLELVRILGLGNRRDLFYPKAGYSVGPDREISAGNRHPLVVGLRGSIYGAKSTRPLGIGLCREGYCRAKRRTERDRSIISVTC